MPPDLNFNRARAAGKTVDAAREFAFDVAGHLDLCGPSLIEGWVLWPSRPEVRFNLEVFADGRLLGQCEASQFRPDLQQAGYADGRCAFTFALPESVSVHDFASVRVRIQNSVLYLVPDDATKVWHQAARKELRAVG